MIGAPSEAFYRKSSKKLPGTYFVRNILGWGLISTLLLKMKAIRVNLFGYVLPKSVLCGRQNTAVANNMPY